MLAIEDWCDAYRETGTMVNSAMRFTNMSMSAENAPAGVLTPGLVLVDANEREKQHVAYWAGKQAEFERKEMREPTPAELAAAVRAANAKMDAAEAKPSKGKVAARGRRPGAEAAPHKR